MDYATLQSRFFDRLDTSSQLIGLFDLLPDVSFFIKDREGRFVSLNVRGQEYCGVTAEEEAIGRTDHDFFPKPRADEYRSDDLAVMKSGEAIHNRIESAPEDAGSPRLVMTSKLPLKDRKGRVIGITGFSRQIEDVREPTGTVSAFAGVVEYLHKHYEERLKTSELAEMSGLSVSQFERRFRRVFGASVRQYLLRVRVENAARQLVNTNNSISQIAQACGFYDHAHFSRCFKRLMRVSPSDWRHKRKVAEAAAR